jgi:hypothetical protein
VISPSQRPLLTQDNKTYKHKRQTSMPRAGFKPAIPATKRPQTYALERAAIRISKHRAVWINYYISSIRALFISFFEGRMFSRWIVTNITSASETLHCRKTRIPCGDQLVICGLRWRGGWVGLRAGLGTEAREQILCLCRSLNLGCPVCSLTLY